MRDDYRFDLSAQVNSTCSSLQLSASRTRCRPSAKPILPYRGRKGSDNGQSQPTSHATSPSSRMPHRQMPSPAGMLQVTRTKSKSMERLRTGRVRRAVRADCRWMFQLTVHPRHPSSLQSPAHTLLRPHSLAHHLHIAPDNPHPFIVCIPNLGLYLLAFMGQIAFFPPLLCILASGIRCRSGMGVAKTKREEMDRKAAQEEGMAREKQSKR